MATYTRNVVTTVAYLIGIRKSILQNTYADEIENLESTVYWAKKFYNDPNYDYFIVDPNNGMLTTGGIVASYGKIGNWMIGKHGMY